MNPSVSPTDDVNDVNDDDALDQLRQLGEELRALFADERHAISSLDHERLEQLAAHKILLASQLAQLHGRLSESSPTVRALFIAIRVEARATAMLAAAATQAVHGLLGYEPAGRYDRRARPQTLTPPRFNVTY